MKFIISALLICFSCSAFAIGEVLKLDFAGTMYCYGEKPQVFNKNTDIDLWLKIDSSSQATLYTNANLSSVVAIMSMDNSMYDNNHASFVAFSGDANNYISVIGVFTFEKTAPRIKSLKGVVIRNGITNSCYSKSKVFGKTIL